MKVKNWRKIAIAIIWSINIFILLFENHQVRQLKTLEARLDAILETNVLVTKNKRLGKEILKASYSLYATAEEPLLGWLEIENSLIKSAQSCGLKNIIVSSPPEFTGNGNSLFLYPINLSFIGKYGDALRWFESVENHMLYADILKVVVNGESSDMDEQTEMYNVVLRARLRKLTTARNGPVARNKRCKL